MTDDWDTYFCNVDDKPASILVDLGAAEAAPLEGLPYMGHVSLALLDPDENGFSSREEYGALYQLEDALESALTGTDNTVYVGRSTTAGRRDFVFYTSAPEGWKEKITAALKEYPAYSWRASIREDKEWETYLEFLYPSEMDMHIIQNRRLCTYMEEQGDDLAKERSIDHWLYFPTEQARTAFCEEIRQEGFSIGDSPAPDRESDDEDAEYEVIITRPDVPAEINDVTLDIAERAHRLGGRYDGWGAAQVAAAK